jgi:hypothetical protein
VRVRARGKGEGEGEGKGVGLVAVRAVGDVDELVDGERVDLLELAREQHARDPDELQARALHGRAREEAVRVVDAEVQRLAREVILLRHLLRVRLRVRVRVRVRLRVRARLRLRRLRLRLRLRLSLRVRVRLRLRLRLRVRLRVRVVRRHLDQPVDEDRAHLRRHVALQRHVVVVHRALALELPQVRVDLASVVARAGGERLENDGPGVEARREIPRREGGGLVGVVRLEGLELVVGLVVGQRRLARLQQADLELALPRRLLPRHSSGHSLPGSGGVRRIEGAYRGLPHDAARATGAGTR